MSIDKQQWIQDTANDLMYFDQLEQTEATQAATEMYEAMCRVVEDKDEQ